MSRKFVFLRSMFFLIALICGLTLLSTSYAQTPLPDAAAVVNALLLNEPFDSTSLPANWSVTGNPGWSVNNPGGRPNQTGGSGNMAIIDSDHFENDVIDTSLITPGLDLSAATAVNLRFKTYFKSYSGSTADVDVSFDGGATWTNIWRKSGANYQGTLSLNVPTAVGKSNVLFRFRYYNAKYAWYWQIDDVQVETPSAPTAPSTLNAVVAGSNVNLTWADNSDDEANFIIEQSPNGTDGWAEAGRVGANVTTFAHQNIECGTSVFYRVKAVNGTLKSGYSNTASVTMTACPFTGTGISENFDAAGSIPTDWTSTGTWYFFPPGGDFSGNVAYVYNVSQTTQNNTLKTPLFNMNGANGVLLTFKTAINIGGAPDPQYLSVEISRNGGTSWEAVWSKTTAYTGKVSIDLSEWAANRNNLMVRFKVQTYYGTVALDEVEIAPMPVPNAPNGLTATLSQYSDVILGWNGSANASYRVERSDDNGGSWKQIAAITNGATSYVDATALTNTTYQYRVRAYNGAGQSPYSSIVSATTGDKSVRYIDVTISLHANAPISTAADRDKYEAIIGYFAEGVYEMSNGANRLREVTFYRDKMNFDTSHIQWIDRCGPNAFPNGYQYPERSNSRILMCDTAVWDLDYLNSEYGQKRAGYTLSHEWGHYFYGLMDEYQGGSADPTTPYQPWSTDPGTSISIMNKSGNGVEDATWLNLSTTTLNFTLKSAQGRIYGADAWTVLSRPKNEDPQIWPATERIYWPELAAAAPAVGETKIELPGAAAAARAELEIVWQPSFDTPDLLAGTSDTTVAAANHVVREIVIDQSALMADSGYLDATKSAVIDVIDQAEIGDTVGIIAFDGSVSEIQAVTDITNDTVKDTLMAAVDAIAAGNANAAGGDALQNALTALTDVSVPVDATRAIYFITAGSQNSGVNPTTVVPDLQDANVQLFIFGFDPLDGDEANLRLLAELTEGDYTSVHNVTDLQKALSFAEQATSRKQDVTLAYEDYWVTEPLSYTVAIDESLSEIDFEFTYYGEAISATIEVESPDYDLWTIDPALDCDTYNSGTDDVETTCYIGFDNPTVGDWTVYIDTIEDLYLIDIETGVAAAGDTTYNAILTSRSGDVVSYPEPIVVEASVSQDYPIGGLYAYGYLYAPDGSKVDVDFKDDGVSPDRIKDDGIYSAYVDYSQNGEHWVTVHFDNYDGLGFYTDLSLNTTDPVLLPTVTENFERYVDLQLTVQDWEEDDHADWPDDPAFLATVLTLDNVQVPGRIDFENDVDVFEINVPLDYTESTLGLRINQLGLGMDPYVYVYAADGSWEFERYLEYEPTADDALFVPLDVNPGETIYVEVWHYDETGTGTYSISAGKYLWSDPIADKSTRNTMQIFLPIVSRN